MKKLLTSYFLKAFLSVSLFLGICGMANANANETIRYYDITVAGFTIGEVKATRLIDGDRTEYLVNSLVSLWFFGTLKVEFTIHSTYENGQFISSRTVSKSNRGEFLSVLDWDGEKYIVDANSYKFTNQDTLQNPIFFSTVLMFFEEPKGTEEFLSENYGLTSPMKRLENEIIEVQIDGNRNKYYFEKGELVKANMQSPIKNYVLKRRE